MRLTEPRALLIWTSEPVPVAAVGTLFAAVSSSTRLQGGLLAILVLPVCLPIVVASTQTLTSLFRDGEPLGAGRLGFLIASDAIYLVLSWLMFERVLVP